MFCNKLNVNILTAHLLAAGVEDAVVCPGSRNAVIVHNLDECRRRSDAGSGPTMRLHPVTDERSAAFVAIGLWLATRRPIVVCVTSGSALLNLLPGVAEAAFRHIPLIIVSADRPARWIGQLDGQTLPQPDALVPYAPCWNMADGDAKTALSTTCVEALAALNIGGGQPVHINVPIEEPLFSFTTAELPVISDKVSEAFGATVPDHQPTNSDHQPTHTDLLPTNPDLQQATTVSGPAAATLPEEILDAVLAARHPAVIIGQYESGRIPAIADLQQMGWTIFAENISNQRIFCDTFETVPDLLVHIGGALVEKRLKLQLRTLSGLKIIRIDDTDDVPATFGHVDYKIKADPATALHLIADAWSAANPAALAASPAAPAPVAPASLRPLPGVGALFVGNSTAVRWTNAHFRADVATYCNRGVNGIEGSLSVAAGHSLAATAKTLCIIGDLSFFYDCNALWNQRLDGRLRILLVNNGKGGIFYRLPGLADSPALDDYVAASHINDARGIAESYRCTYLSAKTADLLGEIDTLVDRLLNVPSQRPVILEVTIE